MNLATLFIDLQDYRRRFMSRDQEKAFKETLIEQKQKFMEDGNRAAALAFSSIINDICGGRIKSFKNISAKESVLAIVERMQPGETKTVNYRKLGEAVGAEYNTIKQYFQYLCYAGVIKRQPTGRHKYEITKLEEKK